MRTRASASLAVQKQLRSIDRGLKAHLDTDAEALHRTRVATRRLREALPLFGHPDLQPPLPDVKRIVQQATRALGGVREMDVALTLIDNIVTEQPELESVLALVRSALVGERLTRLERMRRQVAPRRLQRASQALADHVGDLADGTQTSEVLARRLGDRIEDLRRAIADAGVLYAPERLHRVRLATKKLRYALELAQEMGIASTRRLVAELQGAQACLGLLHDLETVAQFARRALAQPELPDTAAPQAARVLSLLEARIRAQHADYLERRDGLADVIERAAAVRGRAVARSLPAARPRAIRR